jgi:2-dehydro-3-deoxyphosphogalactonate aldolase
MTDRHTRFAAAFSTLPLVAILRGITAQEAESIGIDLYSAGFRLIEVPFNSPDALASIATLRRVLPDDALVGAGTVLSLEQVRGLAACGGELAVMPHADTTIIRAAKDAGLLCIPGIATPTEAFAALAAGADALKIFPAELVSPAILKAILVVLPKGTALLPVGGITPETMAPYLDAGARGFGLGSALYKPGMSCAEVGATARNFVAAWRKLATNRTPAHGTTPFAPQSGAQSALI